MRNVSSVRRRAAVCNALRAGRSVGDREFDRIYPAWARSLSGMHWTPVAIAKRAARLLVRDTRSRVLDVGSGIGKFCHVGALTTGAKFVGIEQRLGLADVARDVAARQQIKQSYFVVGDALAIDWMQFDGIFLFNPFYENIFDHPCPIPGRVTRSETRYVNEVTLTCVNLFMARPGTRVVTFHGFGGPIPAGYRRLLVEHEDEGSLELWEKVKLRLATV